MRPMSRTEINILKERRNMYMLDLWKDAMCWKMPLDAHGRCINPDGAMRSCAECRYH